MTDRGFWVVGFWVCGNVRRLMYQPLIWVYAGCRVLRDEARGLCTTFDAQDRKRLSDTLVDRVRRYLELGRDFLGREVLADKAQAVELAGRQAAYATRHVVLASGFILTPGGVTHDPRLL
jgi:hypothetical protein